MEKSVIFSPSWGRLKKGQEEKEGIIIPKNYPVTHIQRPNFESGIETRISGGQTYYPFQIVSQKFPFVNFEINETMVKVNRIIIQSSSPIAELAGYRIDSGWGTTYNTWRDLGIRGNLYTQILIKNNKTGFEFSGEPLVDSGLCFFDSKEVKRENVWIHKLQHMPEAIIKNLEKILNKDNFNNSREIAKEINSQLRFFLEKYFEKVGTPESWDFKHDYHLDLKGDGKEFGVLGIGFQNVIYPPLQEKAVYGQPTIWMKKGFLRKQKLVGNLFKIDCKKEIENPFESISFDEKIKSFAEDKLKYVRDYILKKK